MSIMTVADPLSADLMMMSSGLLSVVMACRSSSVKLSRIKRDVMLSTSFSTTSTTEVSRAGSLQGVGVQVLLVRNGLGSGCAGKFGSIRKVACDG